MNAEVRLLFHELADLAPEDQARVLAQRRIPREMRSEVESLLRFDPREAHELTECVGGFAGALLRTSSAQGVASCRPYRMIRLLGRGGMGSVYLAERSDGEIQKTVAIKLLRADADRPGWRERFLKERQLLASLNHPCIVQLIDAGHTADGRPYLVMEYVDGKPLDEFAAGIGIDERLALFLRLCDGISHAHRHLIVHRDLKPSNILVNASGEPKILDFGVAKLLDESGEPTQTAERFLTPNYASPEQLRGLAQTTASDTYSLGVLLYSLLTGRLPQESYSACGAIGCIADHRPITRPSRLNPEIPADVDYILAKALRAEPEERYTSVEAFAGDIRAFLESRPVSARAGNASYRARKFVRRHWIPVAATALVIFTLLSGVYVANRERAIAERRFRDLRRLAHTFVFDLHDEVAKLEGSTKVRELMVRTGVQYLDSLARDAGEDLELQNEVARGYMKIGDVQGFPTKPNLGRVSDAFLSYRKAGEMYRNIAAKDTTYLRDLAVYYMTFADLLRLSNEPVQGRQTAESAVHTIELVRTNTGTTPQLETLYARSWCTLGDMDADMNRTAQAYMEFSKCAELARAQLVRSKDRGVLFTLATASERVGDAAAKLGMFAEALRAMDEDEAVLAELSAADPRDSRLQRPKALLYHYRACIYYDDRYPNVGDPARALENAKRYLELTRAMAHNDPNNTSARFSQAVAMFQVSALLQDSDPRKAVAIARDSVRAFDELLASAKPSFLNQSRRLLAVHRLAEAQLKAGQIAEARRNAEAAVAGQRLISAKNPKDMDARLKLVPMLAVLGNAEAASHDITHAEEHLREAVDQARRDAGSDAIEGRIAMSHALQALGSFHAHRGRAASARACYADLAALWRSFPQHNEYVERQRSAAERLLASIQ